MKSDNEFMVLSLDLKFGEYVLRARGHIMPHVLKKEEVPYAVKAELDRMSEAMFRKLLMGIEKE